MEYTRKKMTSEFKRLIRFEDTEGRVLYGESPSSGDMIGQQVSVYAGNDPWHLEATDAVVKIAKVGTNSGTSKYLLQSQQLTSPLSNVPRY